MEITWEHVNNVESHVLYVCMLKLRPTLCDCIDCNPPGSAGHGIFQARILELVVISFSRGLANPGIEPTLLYWQAGSVPLSHPHVLLD